MNNFLSCFRRGLGVVNPRTTAGGADIAFYVGDR